MRKIAKSELSKILKEHKRWCDTDKKEGEHADLSNADLSGADLSKANLRGANLVCANLSDADLSNVNLSDADLSSANLYNANMSEADLREAILSGADLSGTNLSSADLSDANLSYANLNEVLVFGLNIEQFIGVRTLYKAELDPELMEQVKDEYPHLLKDPDVTYQIRLEESYYKRSWWEKASDFLKGK